MWSVKSRLLLAAVLALSLVGLALDQWFPLLVGLGFAIQLLYAQLIFRPEGSLVGERHVPIDRIREGNDLDISTTLTNQGSATAFLELREALPRQLRLDEGRSASVAALSPGRSRTLDMRVRAPLLGVYNLGPLEARSEDPFALYFEEHEVLAPNELIVMPAEAPIEEVEPVVRIFQSFQGEYQVNQPGDGFDFFGMRDYVPGDVYRAINWKASARTNKLIVNQFERTTSSQITFLVDGRAMANVGIEDRTPFVHAARAVAALLRDFFGRRDTPRLVIYGHGLHVVHPGPPERMITECLETLAMWQCSGDEPLHHALDDVLPTLVEGSPVILFSSLLDDPTVLESVALLLSHDFVVHVVAPPVSGLEGLGEAETRAMLSAREATIAGLRGFDIDVVEPRHLEALTEVVS